MYIIYETWSESGASIHDALYDYGWDGFFAKAAESTDARHDRRGDAGRSASGGGNDETKEGTADPAVPRVPARVVETRRGLHIVVVRGPGGSALEIEAVVSGRFRGTAANAAEFPAVGDWVLVRRPELDGRAVIDTLLARKSRFSRKAPDGTAGAEVVEQVLAANVDVALVVTSADGDYSPRRIERYLTLAREAGVEPVVVLSKADLAEDIDLMIAGAMEAAPGVPVMAVSAFSGEGMDRLSALVGRGRTTVLLGSSGAGKSTLLNALAGSELQSTGAVKEYDGRGRHTTTSRTLKLLPSGALVIDTPGLREVQILASEGALGDVFTEIEELAGSCRFRDCTHENEPGCAVKAAVEAGELSELRYGSWLKLGREIRHLETKTSKSAAATERAKWKSIAKSCKVHAKVLGR